jgi:hypothetical protein
MHLAAHGCVQLLRQLEVPNGCWCPRGHCTYSAEQTGHVFVFTTGVCVEPGCLQLVSRLLMHCCVTENPGRFL